MNLDNKFTSTQIILARTLKVSLWLALAFIVAGTLKIIDLGVAMFFVGVMFGIVMVTFAAFHFIRLSREE